MKTKKQVEEELCRINSKWNTDKNNPNLSLSDKTMCKVVWAIGSSIYEWVLEN